MGLKRHGRRGYAAAIEHDVALARFLADEVDARGPTSSCWPSPCSRS